jgi:hypothetical protein
MDIPTVRRLCATTNEALQGFDDGEIKTHIAELERLTTRADELLKFWEQKNVSALSDKETFEGVIENLVKHARKVRK